MIYLKSKPEISLMREAGRVVAHVVAELCSLVKDGVSTGELDRIGHGLILKAGAVPTFIGYEGYRHSTCISVNHQVVHGIPDDSSVIREGDVVSIDCAVTLKGFVADHAVTVPCGRCTPEHMRLIEETKAGLLAGIEAAVVGNRVGDVSRAVEAIGGDAGYGIVREFVGHGIGRKMHEEPQVPNYASHDLGPRLRAGLVLAIEPMFNLGTPNVKILKDGWTVVTNDGRASAHFEHTVAVTEDGPVILTLQ